MSASSSSGGVAFVGIDGEAGEEGSKEVEEEGGEENSRRIAARSSSACLSCCERLVGADPSELGSAFGALFQNGIFFRAYGWMWFAVEAKGSEGWS